MCAANFFENFVYEQKQWLAGYVKEGGFLLPPLPYSLGEILEHFGIILEMVSGGRKIDIAGQLW